MKSCPDEFYWTHGPGQVATLHRRGLSPQPYDKPNLRAALDTAKNELAACLSMTPSPDAVHRIAAAQELVDMFAAGWVLFALQEPRPSTDPDQELDAWHDVQAAAAIKSLASEEPHRCSADHPPCPECQEKDDAEFLDEE